MSGIVYNRFNEPKHIKALIEEYRPKEIRQYEEDGHMVRVFDARAAEGVLRNRI